MRMAASSKPRAQIYSDLLSSILSDGCRQRGKRTIITTIRASIFFVPAIFIAHAGEAQNAEVLRPASLAQNCKQSNLSGVALMQAVHTIITHGDLTDIVFTEKTLETKFSSKSYAQTIHGTPDTGGVLYQVDNALGSPIRVSLFINYSKERQLKSNLIAGISIKSGLFLNSDANFIVDCLKISESDFSDYFGGGFLVNLATCCGDPYAEANKEPGSLGKNNSRIYLGIDYVIRNNAISEIQIAQDIQRSN